MRRALLWLAVLASVIGCSDLTASRARKGLLGFSQDRLTSCVGAPDKAPEKLSDGGVVFAKTFKSDKSPFGVSVPMVGAVSLGATGGCTALFTLHDGKVTEVHYEGTESGWMGKLAACGPIVDDCTEGG